MMAAAATGMALRVKPLISFQGLLTLLGLGSGIAAILLPVGAADWKPVLVIEYGIPLMAAWLAAPSWSDLPFVLAFGMPQLTLAVPISAGYLRWILTGELPRWAWRTGYVLAALGGTAQLAILGWGLFWVFSGSATANDGSYLYLFCGFTLLALGAWVLTRNRRRDLSHALNALIALQVVYVADVLPLLLVSLLVDEVMDHMLAGAWFALLTIVVYVVQMVLGSRSKGGIEHSAHLATR